MILPSSNKEFRSSPEKEIELIHRLAKLIREHPLLLLSAPLQIPYNQAPVLIISERHEILPISREPDLSHPNLMPLQALPLDPRGAIIFSFPDHNLWRCIVVESFPCREPMTILTKGETAECDGSLKPWSLEKERLFEILIQEDQTGPGCVGQVARSRMVGKASY